MGDLRVRGLSRKPVWDFRVSSFSCTAHAKTGDMCLGVQLRPVLAPDPLTSQPQWYRHKGLVLFFVCVLRLFLPLIEELHWHLGSMVPRRTSCACTWVKGTK